MSNIGITDDIKIEEGIFGFFDILGYQKLLEENHLPEDLEDIAKQIFAIINNFDKKITDRIASYVDKDQKDFVEKIFSSEIFQWNIFSDTIILTCNMHQTDESSQLHIWLFFIILSQNIYSEMFELGLPVRGAIGFGKFIKQKQCIAGKPLVETYKYCHNLDLAACVLTEDARKQLESLSPFSSIFSDDFKNLLVEYPVPLKTGEKKLFSLPWNKREYVSDLRQAVLDSFWKFQKNISSTEHSKVDNTEKFLRFQKFYLKNKKG